MGRASRTLAVFLLVSLWYSKALGQNDYSRSVSEPIDHLIALIQNGNSEEFKMVIINRHNGRYQLNSSISNLNETIRVSTHINDMTNTESDTSFTLPKGEFVNVLNKLKNTKRQFAIAGNYQDIEIRGDGIVNKFYTRKAFGLMAFLREGKSNTKGDK